MLLLLPLLQGCEPAFVPPEPGRADLNGTWDGSTLPPRGSNRTAVGLCFNLSERDGRVTGTAIVGLAGRHPNPLVVEGTYDGPEVVLHLTGTAAGTEMEGDMEGHPWLSQPYRARLSKLNGASARSGRPGGTPAAGPPRAILQDRPDSADAFPP